MFSLNLLIEAKKCDWNLQHAIPLSQNLYPHNKIDVKCAAGFIPVDRSLFMSVICEFNETTQAFEWNKKNFSQCIENYCRPHEDFKLISENIRKSSYSIGEQINYTCPSGYRIRTLCEIDRNTGFGIWDFDGSCAGKFLHSTLKLDLVFRIVLAIL